MPMGTRVLSSAPALDLPTSTTRLSSLQSTVNMCRSALQCCTLSVSLVTASQPAHDCYNSQSLKSLSWWIWRYQGGQCSPYPNIAVSCILCQYLTMSQCFSEVIREQSDNTTITKCKHATRESRGEDTSRKLVSVKTSPRESK